MSKSVVMWTRKAMRDAAVSLLFVGACGPLTPKPASAAVVAVGNVSPAPPLAGGNINAPFFVGDSGVGQLQINSSGGATVLNVGNGNSATIGDDPGSVGAVLVTTAGAAFTTAQDLIVGNGGAGNIVISNFAQLSVVDDVLLGVQDSASGTMFVDGLGTLVDIPDGVLVGQAGTGLIQVTAGGRLFVEDAILGQSATGDGGITVSGNASLWQQTSAITIGNAGRGVLQVVTGGRVETNNAVAGNLAAGVGTINVSGVGSIWDVTGSVTLAIAGQGSLNITDGGRVTNTTTGRLATAAGSEARVLVSGVGSNWNNAGTLSVGETGFGSMRVVLGGRVMSTNSIIGDNAGSRGEAFVDGIGSVWEVDGTLDVSDAGEGELTIANGGLVTTTANARIGAAGELSMNGGRLQVGGAGGLTNQGLIVGAGRLIGSVSNNALGEIRTHAGDVLVLTNTLNNAGLVNWKPLAPSRIRPISMSAAP
jgi:T5SS/PEP-CTERM-associated repeat protein